MADLDLTQSTIRLSGAAVQPLFLSMEVSSYSLLEMFLYAPSIEGASSCLGVNIYLRTGMQIETDDGWVNLYAFPTFNVPNFALNVTLSGGFMKYIRWSVGGIGGATAATFWITGIGR